MASELRIDSLLPEYEEWGKVLAQRAANSIDIAHGFNPNSWRLHVTGGTPFFAVGSHNIISLDEGGCIFLIDRDALQNIDLESLSGLRDTGRLFKSHSSFVYLWIGPEQMEHNLHVLGPAHEQAVRLLTNEVKTRANRWEQHRDDFRQALNQQFGLTIPEPGYLEHSTNPKPLLSDPSALTTIISDIFATRGLSYSNDQIAAFYTALQTKGFVVLSGISGTGKSKIATGFVSMLPDGPTAIADTSAEQAGLIELTVKPYMQKYKRVILPKNQTALLPSIPLGHQHEVILRMGNTNGTGRLEHRMHSGDSSITVLYFRGEIGNKVSALESGTRIFINPTIDEDGDAISEMELLLSEDVRRLNRELSPHNPALSNNLFLSVRPDWRDSTSLLGYFNPLTQTYEWTDFLKFILRAAENYAGKEEERIAWFVILDEMNLAHVEYYFADLLSIIESGRDAKGMTSEPLRLTFPDTLDDEMPPHEIFLPPNLYIIGTVNMDKTTHAFSPKVLDRAFTIELTDVDFTNYPPEMGDSSESGLTKEQKQSLLEQFSRDGQFARIDKSEISTFVEANPVVRHQLQALNTVLTPFRMHFGYRVFDEIVQYLANNEQNGMADMEDAFDQAVFMKVLPKFTGSRARLGDPLRKMLVWAIDPDGADIDPLGLWIPGISIEGLLQDSSFRRTAKRVAEMLDALERDGFVSFG